ncbi:collagen alpha-1(III) chain-like [Pteropus alecto]|uniref:collagen alpha-1(III) chain-like n=1 Tax=Pteropus alecto TaxID=9402 RepID=UPI000D536B62|nr:collagen alpha-1(III) chain-like [Pteropus alecto]
MGIAEGTASLFVDSWRAGNCPAALERETDPCSMSQLNSECRAAEGRRGSGDPSHVRGKPTGVCPRRGERGDPLLSAGEDGHRVREVPRPGEPQALLQGGQGLRAGGEGCGHGAPAGPRDAGGRAPMRCLPAEVRVPGLQLRRDLPAHLCRPGGLRTHLCLTGRPAPGLERQRGQLQCVQAGQPGGRRGSGGHDGGPGPEAVPGHLPKGLTSASPTAIPCTGNQTFSYDSHACSRTCLSLSDRTAECHRSAVPVDGCNCPEGTYLNHEAKCVRKAQCPCLLANHKFIPPNQSTMVDGVVWCVRGSGRVAPTPACGPGPSRPIHSTSLAATAPMGG